MWDVEEYECFSISDHYFSFLLEMVPRRKILWKGVTTLESDAFIFVYVSLLSSVAVYIYVNDHLHVCGIFIGGEEVSNLFNSVLPEIGLYKSRQKHGRKWAREAMLFPFMLEEFWLHKVICYHKVQIRRANGEFSLWIVCIPATFACICHGIY